jgi:hypothetical protein
MTKKIGRGLMRLPQTLAAAKAEMHILCEEAIISGRRVAVNEILEA